jgi:hypothetical protein
MHSKSWTDNLNAGWQITQPHPSISPIRTFTMICLDLNLPCILPWLHCSHWDATSNLLTYWGGKGRGSRNTNKSNHDCMTITRNQCNNYPGRKQDLLILESNDNLYLPWEDESFDTGFKQSRLSVERIQNGMVYHAYASIIRCHCGYVFKHFQTNQNSPIKMTEWG